MDLVEFSKKKGFKVLDEKKLTETSSDTLFIGASIMANMEIINKKENFKYVTRQRILSANRLEDIGVYPLATPFEIMNSIFLNGPNALQEAINIIIMYLNTLGFKSNDLILLHPRNIEITKILRKSNIQNEHMVTWNKELNMHYGSDYPNGKYIKIFVPYNDGVLPVGTIGFIKREKGYFVDSALFFERLSFAKKNLKSWFEDDLYFDLIKNIKTSFTKLKQKDVYKIATLLRTIIILRWDGVNVSNNKQGYILKKIIRDMFETLYLSDYRSILNEINYHLILDSLVKSLSIVGYDVSPNFVNAILNYLIADYENYVHLIKKEEKNILKDHKRNRMRKFENYLGQTGISYNILSEFYLQNGFNFIPKPTEHHFWFRNESYKFKGNNIKDPVEFIRLSEDARMLGNVK